MTARGPRVLVVDDQPKTADFLRRHAPDLALLGPSAEKDWAGSWSEAEAALARAGKLPDLVVLDLRFDVPDEELLPDQRSLGETAAGKRDRRDRRDRQGLFILERLRRREPDLPVLLTTAHEEIPFEDEARRLRADAFTYTVGEDEATGEGLVRLVRRVLDERESPLSTGRFFWGRSAAMRDLRRRIASLAPTPLPLLLTGPTGSGKNFLVKEVIHPLSSRKGPLVSFDCATVPETLL
ncbi:MAG: sigma 54-interacting transcriptional regulator, partial [Acidobacteriota bacterium]|nr:sigma 54-interacting transcriptional regulator [Acidobacteriota bacterium]